MLKRKIASIILASVIAVGSTGITAFAAEATDVNGETQSRASGNKAAAYRALTDEEKAELKAQIFANLTAEQKAAIIEKMGKGKGRSLGQNHKGGKSAAFASMTDEEKAELKAQIFANLTAEQKAAIIEKMGKGKGRSLGQNHKGGKSAAFASMTDEQKAALRAERRNNRTVVE